MCAESQVLCILFILTFISFTAAQIHCNNDAGNFTENDTYVRNRDHIFSSLSSNVVENKGFYSTTFGQHPDKVYALALCRADEPSEVCNLCINKAIQRVNSTCLNQKEVTAYPGDPPCIVRYSNRSFLRVLELEPLEIGYNVYNISSSLTEFDRIWQNMMSDVIGRASNGTKLKFSHGEVSLTQFQTIYTTMQCTPDVSELDCFSCLRQSVNSYQSCCYGRKGGYVHRPNCIWRWDLYPFYASPLPPITPSSPPESDPPVKPSPILSSSSSLPAKRKNKELWLKIVVIIVPIAVSILLFIVGYSLLTRRGRKKYNVAREDNAKTDDSHDIYTVESLHLQYDLNSIEVATNNFAEGNRLGQGGFGVVYKGVFSNGHEVAVKRLSRSSGQGVEEFKNEAVLASKLQHRNLVRVLGFCVEREEKILVYEIVPNKSLDHILFADQERRELLNWSRRYKIISGVARGILYLHVDSRLRIIHRDLKASNVLLDNNMNPKISDFGMARIFPVDDQTQGNTSRIVGTYGYMPPEYVMHGQFSVKLDIYSFGILILEILSGKRNCSFYQSAGGGNLMSYAWNLWKEGRAVELLDPILGDSYSRNEAVRCLVIGLLCVQEDPSERPTIATVVLMLNSYSATLLQPKQPAFFLHSGSKPLNVLLESDQYANDSQSIQHTLNEASITDLHPR